MKPNPYTTVVKELRVVIVRKVYSEFSNVKFGHVGKIYKIIGIEYGGRMHNRYISAIHLHSSVHGELRAVLDELALLNPNCEPEGEFVVCVGCGASAAETELKIVKHIKGMKACPSCGMLEPDKS